jgi:hypothetical protein
VENEDMIQERRAAGQVRLYRARKFPDQWEYVATLFSGSYADRAIFRHADRWWIFAEHRAYTLTLWSAPTLEGPWEQHPQSPVYVNLKTAVAGLKMAHLPKVALAFEFLSARPDGARAVPPKSSKSCALLSACTILLALN